MKVMRRILGLSMALVMVTSVEGIYDYGKTCISRALDQSEVEVTCEDSTVPNLMQDYDKDSVVCGKLKYDKEKHESKLSKGVEEKLNEAGVFDSEIAGLEAKEIKKINAAETISVQVGYYSVDNETGERDEMSQEDVEELIEEKIDAGEMDYDEPNDSIVSSCAFAIGLGSIKAKAAKTKRKTEYSSSGALKQVLICSQSCEGGSISVTFQATWLEEAYYRGKDVVGVSLDNMRIIDNSWSCKHTAKVVEMDGWGRQYKSTKTTHPKSFHKGASSSGIAVEVNLFGNRDTINYQEAYGNWWTWYNDETIKISFDCKRKSSKDDKVCSLSSDYYHWKSSLSVDPSISFDTGGITVSVAASKKDYYQKIFNNVYLTYKPI